MTPPALAPPACPADPMAAVASPLVAASAGRVLRLKLGYNPNSSSIGTIVFGIPASLVVLTAGFAAAASVLAAALLGARPRRSSNEPAADAPGTAGRPGARADGEAPANDSLPSAEDERR